jgi:TPR repeat protein
MRAYPSFFFILVFVTFLLAWPALGMAEESESSAKETATVDDIYRDDDLSPYGEPNIDPDDDDEDGLPENVIKEQYGNARMAFLFGQYKVAYKAWLPLAEEGYAKAQAALAWMYHTGNGVPKDLNKAFQWYKKAAEQEHAIAQNNLAVMYENGLGTKVDKKAAAKWYRESADSGYSFAQYNMGRMYAEGIGVKQDLEEAKYWWRVAARQKVKQAKEALALLEDKPLPKEEKHASKGMVAHAPYHSNPVAKGLAWIESQKKEAYTIQLARSQDQGWLLKLAAKEKLDDVLVQFKNKDSRGDDWYHLIYGSYPSYQQAELARKSLPQNLRRWSPTLRRFGEIQEILRKQAPLKPSAK